MTVRTEIETRLITWAQAQSPPIPVAVEGVPFVRPTSGPFLSIAFLKSATTNVNIDGTRIRQTGGVQINCCVLDGTGSRDVEALAQNIVNLFPVVPKTIMPTVSIEKTPDTGVAIPDNNWRILPVTLRYRVES